MGFKDRVKKRLGIKPRRRRNAKEEKRRKGIFGFLPGCTCNPTVILVVVALVGIMWINAGAPDPAEFVDDVGDWVNPFEDIDEEEEEVGIYYQIGLEFPVRPEDIDVWMIAELSTSDHVTFIENIGLGPIGLYGSANDYKPDDMFFLSMFYGDADYNISFSTVITVGGEQGITVYINGVAIDEVLNLTWIADGSGTRWNYP